MIRKTKLLLFIEPNLQQVNKLKLLLTKVLTGTTKYNTITFGLLIPDIIDINSKKNIYDIVRKHLMHNEADYQLFNISKYSNFYTNSDLNLFHPLFKQYSRRPTNKASVLEHRSRLSYAINWSTHIFVITDKYASIWNKQFQLDYDLLLKYLNNIKLRKIRNKQIINLESIVYKTINSKHIQFIQL